MCSDVHSWSLERVNPNLSVRRSECSLIETVVAFSHRHGIETLASENAARFRQACPEYPTGERTFKSGGEIGRVTDLRNPGMAGRQGLSQTGSDRGDNLDTGEKCFDGDERQSLIARWNQHDVESPQLGGEIGNGRKDLHPPAGRWMIGEGLKEGLMPAAAIDG